MAGTRTEKIGTVFSRVQGLLKSGAMKEADKPIWYDVMVAFPPKVEPKYDRLLDIRKTTDIVYREDFIRMKYYNRYGDVYPVDMTNNESESNCKTFIDKYQVVEKEHPDESEEGLMDIVAKKLKQDGIVLKTWEEIKEERKQAKAMALEARRKQEMEIMNNKLQLLNFSKLLSEEDTRVGHTEAVIEDVEYADETEFENGNENDFDDPDHH